METQDYTPVIIRQSAVTSIYGLIVLIFSIVTLFTIGGLWMLTLALLCMSVFCSLTSMIGRRAARFQSTLSASRYSTWCLMNFIIWGGVGAYATYLQILVLVYFLPPGVSIPVSLVWSCIYLSGFALCFKNLKVAKLFLASVSRQGLNPESPAYQQGYAGSPAGYQPGNAAGYQPGNAAGYQPGNAAGYQPGNAAGYRPYSGPAQPVNYFAPGTNVYYGHPMNNPPAQPPGPAVQGGNNYQ